MTVLIADDDPINLRMLEQVLGKAGYRVETATNGKEAIEKVLQGHIRIVITDWEMPEMTGPELCRAIRAGNLKRYVYVLMLSAKESGSEVVEGLAAGADDFVRKPFFKEELLMRVRTGTRIVSMETLDMTIFAMAKLAEMRDTETGKHVERVARYSRALSRQLAKDPAFAGIVNHDFVNLVYQTAPLHDIGKVAIPDAILMKSMPLTNEEFALMRTHTTLGSATLEAAIQEYPDTPFLVMARDIALTHHERWDGTGYPRKLSGTDIPLVGRIVALADVYDAMTSARPYKRAFDHAYARAEILRAAGTHFDPDIVEAFRACEIEFIRILNEYGEREHLMAA